MPTKTCKNCGWVYPITQPGSRCLICGAPFDLVICRECGEVKPIEQMMPNNKTWCRQCYNAYAKVKHHEYNKRFKSISEARYNAWLDKVHKVPTDYPPLTEAQWLEACEYFKGCARCASEDIDARGFFIGRSLGGRYCDWNVIPVCEHCAKIWALDLNVFTYTRNKELINRRRSAKGGRQVYTGVTDSPTEFRDSLENIIKYLEVKLDNAIKFTGNTAGHTEGPECDANAHNSG